MGSVDVNDFLCKGIGRDINKTKAINNRGFAVNGFW